MEKELERRFKKTDSGFGKLTARERKIIYLAGNIHREKQQQSNTGPSEELERRQSLIKSEPNGIVRETMIDNLLDGLDFNGSKETQRNPFCENKEKYKCECDIECGNFPGFASGIF